MAPDAPPKTPLYVGIVVVVVLAAFLLGFWARDAGPFADSESELKIHTAPLSSDFTYSLKGLSKGHKIAMELHTLDGKKVDVLLLNETNYRAYKQRLFFDYIEAGSGLKVTNFTTTFQVSQADVYYWVVDNTEQPPDGANAGQDVTFKAKVEK